VPRTRCAQLLGTLAVFRVSVAGAAVGLATGALEEAALEASPRPARARSSP
jgi:alkylation response protein AidB-like acyl-CoA dehydrogenase